MTWYGTQEGPASSGWPTPPPPTPGDLARRRVGWIVGGVAGLAVASVAVFAALAPAAPEHGPAQAIAACQLQVRNNLKAPSTARYPDDDTATNIGGNVWTVTGHVDAGNSYGAKIRSRYTCTVTFISGGADVEVGSITPG